MLPPALPTLPIDEQRVWMLAYSAAYATRRELTKVNPAIDQRTLLECVADGTVTAYRRIRDEGPPTREDAGPSDARFSGGSSTP